MINPKEAKQWLQQTRVLFYVVSFISFWAAIYLQTYIAQFLSTKVSGELINVLTVFSMWILAIYIFPIIGAVVILYFMVKRFK